MEVWQDSINMIVISRLVKNIEKILRYILGIFKKKFCRCPVKQLFLEIMQNSQENACVGDFAKSIKNVRDGVSIFIKSRAEKVLKFCINISVPESRF